MSIDANGAILLATSKRWPHLTDQIPDRSGSHPALPKKDIANAFCYGLRSDVVLRAHACRHGLTDCSGPPHSAQRSRAER